MRTSDQGADFIQRKEGGFVTKAYKDSGGVWTIGAGHIKNVRAHDICSVDDARKWLHEDLREAESAVDKVRVPLAQHEYDALVSFAYNVGNGAFASSTLVRMLNAGDRKTAVAAQFDRWNKVKGKVVNGLTNRRQAEKTLFLKGDYSA